VHGQLDSATKEIGYVVYIGGSGGRVSRPGVRLEKVYTEDEVLHIIEKVVKFYKDHAKPRQRLGALIEEMGIDEKDIIDTA
jgi:dissimilatory sulfite reductase (desulfoviridin) alpha/beta subunit